VLRVKAHGQRDLITVLGHAAMIVAGEFVQASGTWVTDRTHGIQFSASFLKATAHVHAGEASSDDDRIEHTVRFQLGPLI
jgi:hypothetical protein